MADSPDPERSPHGRSHGPRRPPMPPDAARHESAIEAAIARGDFDDLPGAGRPLDLPRQEDPDWWIKRKLEDDDLDRDALLPPVMLLRREAETLSETSRSLPTEHDVREHLEDFNARVLADRARNPLARMLAPTVDVEERVARWRDEQAREGGGSPAAAVASTAPGERRGLFRRLFRRR